MFVYRYDMMRELLEKFRDWDGDRHEALMVEYVDPTTGRPVYKTMTFFMQMLRPGERTLAAEAEREPGVLALRRPRLQRDRRSARRLGAIRHLRRPRRHVVRARQSSDKDPAILFVASDEPTLKALALYQKHGKNEHGDIVRLRGSNRHMARSKNARLLAHIDCPGGGQVWVDGKTLYVGHMREPTGTTIVDIADPAPPQVSRGSRCRRAGIRTRYASPTG